MKTWAILGTLLLATMAGCLSDSEGDDTSDGGEGQTPTYQRYELPDDPMPEGAGHDHADPAQHRYLWNYDFSARDPLLQNAANVAGVHALDVQAGYLFGAVYGSHSAAVDGGLVIWDLADPAHPVQTGRWVIPGSVGGDRSMEATPDGEFAVIATEAVDCAGHVNPLGATVNAYLIDTSNKELPVVADVLAQEQLVADTPVPPGTGDLNLGEHSVAVHRIHDQDYAFVFGKIYRIDRTEQGGQLTYINTIPTGHDIYVRDTPWNTTWALSANGGGGLAIHDVTDPANPWLLATWDLSNRTEVEHYFHTADVSFLPDGQVLVVLTSEDWGDVVSPLWVIDGNVLRGVDQNPGEPFILEHVGTWQNPGRHPALAGLTFSLHNPRFHDGGILSLSSYHGGMWQLDLRAPEFWSDPAPIGYAAFSDGEPAAAGDPVEAQVQQQLCGLEITIDAPSYWDIEVGPNGVLYLADGFMGLYTFTPADSHPVFGANRTMEYLGTAGT